MAQIYRVGKDIFDASTNQKIANPTVLATQYKGATEVNAPSQIPTGATKILNPAGLQGLNESQIFRQGADIYKLPSVISSDKITGGAAPTIKPVEPSFTDTAPYVAGLDTTTKGLESLVNTALAPTPQEAKITPITSKITELTGQFEQKPVDYQAELDKYGFKTNVQDLQNLNTQIASVKAQYDKFSVGQEGRTASASSIYGRQALAQRQAAVELGGLSSIAQALQGNVQMAQNIADKTIAIKYEPVEQEIANQKFQLEQVYEQLSRDEKKKADALKITLDERQILIDEQKTKDADINKLMVAAAGQSAPLNILQEMLKAKTPQEAIVIGRDYLKTFNGYTDLGNGNYVNNTTGTVNTIDEIKQEQNLAQGIVTTSTGDAYDIKSYATDPNHEKAVQSILNGIGQFKTIQDIDNYIQSNYPGSKVTGQMVANAAGKYGVSWEMMVAIMAQDSGMGTKGLGSRNNNPGNIGQFDSLGKQGVKGYETLQEGVDAVAKNLAGRKTTSVATTPITPVNSIAVNWAENIRDGKAKLSDITSEVEKSNPGLKSEVNSILKSLPPSERQINEAKDFVKKLKELKDSSGLKYAVGPNWVTRGMVGIGGAFGAKDDFLGKAQTLISKKALGALIEAKSQGATFGALSDAELALLKSSGTTLGAWANEKNEKITGFDISEKKFKEELDNMITEYEKIITQANGGQSISVMSEDDAYKLYQQTVNK